MSELFDPSPEDQKVVLVDGAILRRAEGMILGCEGCSKDAEIPFDYVLDWMTGLDPAVTDYLLNEPAKCPKCRGDVTEKTLVEVAPSE